MTKYPIHEVFDMMLCLREMIQLYLIPPELIVTVSVFLYI